MVHVSVAGCLVRDRAALRRPVVGPAAWCAAAWCAAVLLCAALAAPPAAAQAVWVVAPEVSPGVDFTEPQSAVNAARDGDIVLVRTGAYFPLRIVGKSVTVAADAGALVVLAMTWDFAPIEVRDLPQGGTVVLHGLTLHPDNDVFGITRRPSLIVQNCRGTVWVEDCDLQNGFPALSVSNAVAPAGTVTLQTCTLTGCFGIFDGLGSLTSGEALIQSAGHTSFSGCTLQGGNGHAGFFDLPSILAKPGAAGAVLAAGTCLFSNCTVAGGKGGNGFIQPFPTPTCSPPAVGGDGVRVSAGATLRAIQSLMQGGAGGNPAPDCSNTVPDGQAIANDGGSVELLSGAPPTLTALAPVREGGTLALTLAGTPGDLALLAISGRATAQFLPGLSGELLVMFPASLLALGALPAGGALALSGVLPALPASVEGATLFVQAASAPAPGGWVLGGGATLVLLDGSL